MDASSSEPDRVMAEAMDDSYQQLLIVRCQVGDAAAFEELVATFHPRLRGFLLKMLPGQQSVDDLTQQVWSDVFRDLRSLADARAFTPWLYTIARHHVFRMLRRRERPTTPIEEIDVVEEREQTVEFSTDEAAAVHTALNELSLEHREVLMLRFMEEMSYEEIAAVISCPVGTVRSRIHNGKIKLRTIMERQNNHARD